MFSRLRIPISNVALAEGFTDESEAEGLVFAAAGPEIGEDWDAVAHELSEAFRLTQEAVQAGAPVVYVVAGEDLLGQRGVPAAMIATGLLSAARTTAVETARAGIPINVLAPFSEADPGDVVAWALRLLNRTGVTGEVIRLGSKHLGKALP